MSVYLIGLFFPPVVVKGFPVFDVHSDKQKVLNISKQNKPFSTILPLLSLTDKILEYDRQNNSFYQHRYDLVNDHY